MAEPLPEGLQLTALDPEYRADPYPRLRRVQAEAPVRRDSLFGAVMLTGYGDVRGVLTDRSLWRDPWRADENSPTYRRAAQEAEEGGGPTPAEHSHE